MTRTVVFALATCAVLSGCALFVGKADYADYREVLLAQGDDAALMAMTRYVRRHPDGHYVDEVQAARAARELDTFRSGVASRAGLEKYLAAFPDGTFAEQARARLLAFDVVARQAEVQRARELQLAAERSARQAELRRTWVTRFARYWGKTLLGLSSWGAGIADVAQANPTFSRAFGAEPKPRCTTQECVKYYDSPYAVPVPGATRIERSLSVVLRLRMQDGKLQRAELLWPGRGFSRWYELEHRQAVAEVDVQAREAATAWALESLQTLITDLGSDVREEPQYVLGGIERPTLGPSGQLVDTAAEDPAAPPNRLAAADGGEWVKPQEQADADMVFAPMRIDESGRAHRAPTRVGESAAQVASEPGSSMVMAPMVISKDGTASVGSASAAVADVPAVSGAAAGAVVKSWLWNGLRVVLFAAAADAEGPAYDGLLIERDSARH